MVLNLIEYVGGRLLNEIKRLPTDKRAKILVLDELTSVSVSAVIPESSAIDAKIFLFKKMGGGVLAFCESVAHLAVVLLVEPSPNNINQICDLLRRPFLKEAHLLFTSAPTQPLLTKLAENDVNESIKSLKTFPISLRAIGRTNFVPAALNCETESGVCDFRHISAEETPNPTSMGELRPDFGRSEGNGFGEQSHRCLKRDIDAVMDVLDVFKIKPCVRFAEFSKSARAIAERLERLADKEGNENATALILDRKVDPVTPLLTQWTYQAMIHDHLQIKDQTVSVGGPGETIVKLKLDESDNFFSENKYKNFDHCGESARIRLKTLSEKSESRRTATLDDMRRTVEELPELGKNSESLTNHFRLLTNLSAIVKTRNLMKVSELEQDFACAPNLKPSAAIEKIKEMVDSNYASEDITRMCMLFTARFPESETAKLKAILRQHGLDPIAKTAEKFQRYMRLEQPKEKIDLFNKKFFEKTFNFIHEAIKGVENIYSRHVPLLTVLIEQLLTNKLSGTSFPVAGRGKADGVCSPGGHFVLVYIVGGATFEELAAVHKINEKRDAAAILGGPLMLNSKMFVRFVDDLDKNN